MTTRFRIDSVSIVTSNGVVTYEFPSALTVLAGGVGVGKSTLFELIKYGLGGDALLADVVEKHVTSVTLEITIGARRLRMSRSTLPKEAKRMRIFDIEFQKDLEDHFVDGEEPSISSLLLGAMGLPDNVRAAAGRNSTKQGSRVSFNDVLKYVYVPQGEINKEIAKSGDSYYQPKRRAVFELLFGLTNPEVLDLKSDIARVKGEYETAERESKVVLQFLSDSKTPSRLEVEAALQFAMLSRDRAGDLLSAIQAQIGPAIDRQTQTLRQLLGESEKALGDAQGAQTLLKQEHSDFARERHLVSRDIGQLDRIKSAGGVLASIEFAVCPRCMQDVRQRDVPPHLCRLCLQSDPVLEPNQDDLTFEQNQLRDQLREMESQITQVAQSLVELEQVIESRQALIVDLTEQIHERTANRITPQLQAYADATAQKTEALAKQHELEKTLIQWDRADDLGLYAKTLSNRLGSLEGDLNVAESVLQSRRTEVLNEIDEEIAAVVREVHIPSVSTVSVDRESYLPILDGKKFDKFAPPGGVRTAVQVSYWVALMNVALRRRDTHYPAFLLMDSPRTSLNDDEDMAAALYRKLVTMADAADGRVQVIIGDNELPTRYRQHYDQIDFDYDHPTVSTVPHPGEAAVTTLGEVQ